MAMGKAWNQGYSFAMRASMIYTVVLHVGLSQTKRVMCKSSEHVINDELPDSILLTISDIL